MLELRDRIAAMELALQQMEETDIPGGARTPPPRQSLDHRFDRIDPSVDAAPAPTPAQEKANPFEALTTTIDHTPDAVKHYEYDSIAEKFGLGIQDHEDFIEYTIYNAFVTNLRVCPVHDGQGRFYYVEHRSFLPHIPGAILREGVDKDGKCLGVAHLPIAGKNRFGIGDFTNKPHEVVWEMLGCTGFWTHMRYRFAYETPNGARRSFYWIRTRNNLMDDQGDLVLVEEGVHREHLVLAEYTGKGVLKWKKRGRLRIRVLELFGDDWEKVVVLSWAAVVELSRRRARIRRFSPTHLIGI